MYIIDTKRTPIGKFMGSLSSFSAPELTKPLFRYFLETYPFLRSKTDEVILGNVLSAGIGMNPARIAAFYGGLSKSVPSYTINHVCASGMTAIIQAARAIHSNDADLILAGGMESMSQAPFILPGVRAGFRFGSKTLIDTLENEGLYCSLTHQSMGMTAENISSKFKIDRKSQDQYAQRSHKKASLALEEKVYTADILGIGNITRDEGLRPDASLSKLAKLNPVFTPNGSVTAGNASSISDGAALLFLASQNGVEKHSLTPIAKIIDYVSVGIDPEFMGMGAQVAIQKLVKKNKLQLSDIDIFEINEAFAAQVLAVIDVLNLPIKKVNIYGGAIAVGHPLAASGTRIVMNAITALKQTKGKRAIASVCVGGGQGVAMLLENL